MSEPTSKKADERMSKENRRTQLTTIMYSLFEPAEKQADFTVEMIAAEAGVSDVHVYNLIGDAFKLLRAKLPGPRRSPNTEKHTLRLELAETKEQLKELKAKYENAIKIDFGEAIRTIEQLEARERQLLNIIKMLDSRLRRCGQSIELSDITRDKQISPEAVVVKERAA
jgi:hypothetical protein